MRVARPRARGRQRLSVGPSSAKQAETYSSSAATGCSWWCSPLAMADPSTLPTTVAASRSLSRRVSTARSASRPRMRSRTSRTLYGDTRRYRARARNEVVSSCTRTRRCPETRTGASLSLGPVISNALSSTPRSFLSGVETEGPRQRELAELVADHGLGDVDRHVLAAVVDRDGVADHVGDDRGAA